MCGRFTYPYTWSEIHALYRLTTPPANLQPRYNICPTTPINTVMDRDGRNRPDALGANPVVVEEEGEGDAGDPRAETVADKPMFDRLSSAPGA
jgi:putative SOS response-associated peptidase YedK